MMRVLGDMYILHRDQQQTTLSLATGPAADRS